MGYTSAEAQIVTSLAFAFVAWLYFRHTDRQRRLEVLHKERMTAMEKGIPLPELPFDAPKTHKPADPRAPLLHGIIWLALGAGAMAMFSTGHLFPHAPPLWPLPLPLMFLGFGLILYYLLGSHRSR